ncbi:hypothetical protein [Desulfospira joergensenii]|uniref:hypothetical protein n=1 Tax=Desulfospira joergensenii TaxID=53329 RepID=UPI0003B64CA0|nr:hypothetical protein [Desulfospira joergensenii]
MKQAVIAAGNRKNFSDIEPVLEKNNFVIEWADSGKACLAMCTDKKTIDLLIVDEHLVDMTPKQLVEKAIMTNPMINCVPVSSLAPEEFHDYFEGLGVLMQLPGHPGEKDAQELISCVKKILDLTG